MLMQYSQFWISTESLSLGILRKKRRASYLRVSTLVRIGAMIRPIRSIVKIEAKARASVDTMF